MPAGTKLDCGVLLLAGFLTPLGGGRVLGSMFVALLTSYFKDG